MIQEGIGGCDAFVLGPNAAGEEARELSTNAKISKFTLKI